MLKMTYADRIRRSSGICMPFDLTKQRYCSEKEFLSRNAPRGSWIFSIAVIVSNVSQILYATLLWRKVNTFISLFLSFRCIYHELSSILSTPEGTEDHKVNTLPLSILLGYGSFKVVNMLRCSEVSAAHTLFIRFVVRSRIIL